MSNPIVDSMVKLAKENLIYLSYGEWTGNPEKLEQLDLQFLMQMKLLCELAIMEKNK